MGDEQPSTSMAAVTYPVPTRQTSGAEGGKNFFFRIRVFNFDTFSPALQDQIRAVAARESNATYPFSPGAASRDLGDRMVSEWQQGGAKMAIPAMVQGRAIVPGMGGAVQSFSIVQGQNPAGRDHQYQEWRLPVQSILAEADPQFRVTLNTPSGCQIVYYKTGTLDTRTLKDSNHNEVVEMVKSGKVGFNINFALSCSGRRI